MSETPSVDIVVPVYESLRHVRSCIGALGRWTDQQVARLIVVDDASSSTTHGILKSLIADHWAGEAALVRNQQNLGFLRTANRGMQAGSAPTIVLLNSDAVATPGWLDGLVECVYHAPDVAIVSPLSNHSNLTTIRAYYGTDHLEVAAAVRRVSPRCYPNIRLATGFCMAIRRPVAQELAFFDERYGRGYFEESDLSLRAAELGWRTVADDATYLHHHGWGSFGAAARDELMARNLVLFEERWGVGSHRRLRREIVRQRHFAELERRVAAVLMRTGQPQPRRPLPRNASRHAARSPGEGEVALPSQRTPTHTRFRPDVWQEVADRSPVLPRGPRVRDVLVLLEELVPDPAMTQVLRIADELADAGMAVSIATAGRFAPALFAEPCRLRPFVLSGPDELLDVVPPHRVIVASSPATVYDALLLKDRDGSAIATWFDPQGVPTCLGWPVDAFALARAPLLVDHHLGPLGSLDPRVNQAHPVPQGVCLDTYRILRRPRSREVLIPHDLRGGFVATSEVRRAVQLLAEGGYEPRLYGDGLTESGVVASPFTSQQEEAEILGKVAAVLEIGPVPGLERLRLRCAATGTPLVAAGPTAPTCLLRVPEEMSVVPRGDVDRGVGLALRVSERTAEGERRLAEARRRAEAAPLQLEIDGLRTAIWAIAAG